MDRLILTLSLLAILLRDAAGQCDTLPGGDKCPPTGSENFPDPTDCAYYFACKDGCAKRTHCEADYLFDIVHAWCTYPTDVECGSRPSPSTTSTTKRTTTTDCGHFFDCRGKPDGFYGDPYNCRKYWHCFGTVGEHLMCGPGLYYEVDDVACDYPENVDCGDRPVCDDCDENCFTPTAGTPGGPSTAPGCGAKMSCQGVKDGWYPNPSNCRKYFNCNGGSLTNFLCDGNLLYDENNIWCDYPESVDCGKRPVCDECDENCS